VIARSSDHLAEDATLHKALTQSDADNLAFVVVDGIKSAGESCNDNTYDRRKNLFEGAKTASSPRLQQATGSIAKIPKAAHLR